MSPTNWGRPVNRKNHSHDVSIPVILMMWVTRTRSRHRTRSLPIPSLKPGKHVVHPVPSPIQATSRRHPRVRPPKSHHLMGRAAPRYRHPRPAGHHRATVRRGRTHDKAGTIAIARRRGSRNCPGKRRTTRPSAPPGYRSGYSPGQWCYLRSRSRFRCCSPARRRPRTRPRWYRQSSPKTSIQKRKSGISGLVQIYVHHN